MGSLLSSTRNTRFLPNVGEKYIRSDVPEHITEPEIQWLLQNDVRTILDLRTPEEAMQKPCPLAGHAAFTYYNRPVTGGNAVPAAPGAVALSYLAMVDDALWQTIRLAESAKTKVLYFCNAGKDRTGVVSALLLTRMHVERAVIVQDYLASAQNLAELLQADVQQNPGIDPAVITPHAAYMEAFLDAISEKGCVFP